MCVRHVHCLLLCVSAEITAGIEIYVVPFMLLLNRRRSRLSTVSNLILFAA